MPSVRPEHDAAFWAALAARRWRRTRWRRPAGRTEDADLAQCLVYGTPIHRRGTYYVRPAYTDGTDWLSQQGYDAMVRQTRGERASRTMRPGR